MAVADGPLAARRNVGAVEAYVRLKTLYPDRISLNMLYALQGALLDVVWSELPATMPIELRQLAERRLGEIGLESAR